MPKPPMRPEARRRLIQSRPKSPGRARDVGKPPRRSAGVDARGRRGGSRPANENIWMFRGPIVPTSAHCAEGFLIFARGFREKALGRCVGSAPSFHRGLGVRRLGRRDDKFAWLLTAEEDSTGRCADAISGWAKLWWTGRGDSLWLK